MQFYVFKSAIVNSNRYKNTNLVLLGLLCIFLLTTSAELAADEQTFYTLPRIGGIVLDSKNIGDMQMVGVVVGMRVANAFYLESELNTTVAGGEFTTIGEPGKFDISNFSLYGAYRYVFSRTLYGKLKAGFAYNTFDSNIPITAEADNIESGFSVAGGLGLGFVYFVNNKPAMIEIEFAAIDKSINMFTIGLTIPF